MIQADLRWLVRLNHFISMALFIIPLEWGHSVLRCLHRWCLCGVQADQHNIYGRYSAFQTKKDAAPFGNGVF